MPKRKTLFWVWRVIYERANVSAWVTPGWFDFDDISSHIGKQFPALLTDNTTDFDYPKTLK